MVVSGGGGEEEVFDINFCLPSEIDNFSLITPQYWSFSSDLKEREGVSECDPYKRFPPKDLEKVLFRTVSYGPNFFPLGFLPQARKSLAICMATEKNF